MEFGVGQRRIPRRSLSCSVFVIRSKFQTASLSLAELGKITKNWSRSKIKIRWNDLEDQDQRSHFKWSCQIKIICMILADQDQDHDLSIYCDPDLFSERSPLLDQWKWFLDQSHFLHINKSDLYTQRSKIISNDLIFCTKNQWSSRALTKIWVSFIILEMNQDLIVTCKRPRFPPPVGHSRNRRRRSGSRHSRRP